MRPTDSWLLDPGPVVLLSGADDAFHVGQFTHSVPRMGDVLRLFAGRIRADTEIEAHVSTAPVQLTCLSLRTLFRRHAGTRLEPGLVVRAGLRPFPRFRSAGHRAAAGDVESWREWEGHRFRAADQLGPAFWAMPMAYVVGADQVLEYARTGIREVDLRR